MLNNPSWWTIGIFTAVDVLSVIALTIIFIGKKMKKRRIRLARERMERAATYLENLCSPHIHPNEAFDGRTPDIILEIEGDTLTIEDDQRQPLFRVVINLEEKTYRQSTGGGFMYGPSPLDNLHYQVSSFMKRDNQKRRMLTVTG